MQTAGVQSRKTIHRLGSKYPHPASRDPPLQYLPHEYRKRPHVRFLGKALQRQRLQRHILDRKAPGLI